LKDHEEIFYKITDPKEIESVMSWFTSYFEFSEPLTEKFIEEYEALINKNRAPLSEERDTTSLNKD
jgi:hypothetical protein